MNPKRRPVMIKNAGSTVARNISVMFGAQSVTWISGFILLMFLPRYLGSEDYGRLYLALSIKMILGLLIDFGGNYLIPKEVARSREGGGKIMSSYVMIRVLLWVLSVGVIMLVSDLLGYSDHVYMLIMILIVAKLFEGFTTALSAYLQGIQRMEYESLGMITERVFVAILSIIALLFGAGSTLMAVIICIGTLLNLLVLVWFARNHVTLSFRFNSDVFRLFKPAVPYFLFSLFSVIYYRVDAVMLSAMTNETVTGWYGGAFRFFDIVMILPVIYKTAIFPVFSKYWDDETGYLQHTVGKSLKLVLILAVPVTVIVFLFAENIIRFFMGLDEYAASVIILQIFAVSIPVIFIDIILGSAILGAANRQRAWAVVGLGAVFLNIGINYILIPYTHATYLNGGIGAAVATFLTEVFMLLAAVWLLSSGYLTSFRFSYIAKPVLSGIVMALTAWGLSTYFGVYWMLSMLIASAVYLGGLFLLKIFDENELKLIYSLRTIHGLKLMLSNKNA